MNANFTYLWQEENNTRNRHIKPSSGKDPRQRPQQKTQPLHKLKIDIIVINYIFISSFIT